MKRTLIAAGLLLASGAALADAGLPQPSFNDGSNVEPQLVTGSRTVANRFPGFNGGGSLGGPTGPATVLLQSEQPEALRQALVVPSFNG